MRMCWKILSLTSENAFSARDKYLRTIHHEDFHTFLVCIYCSSESVLERKCRPLCRHRESELVWLSKCTEEVDKNFISRIASGTVNFSTLIS
eukprot:TRINITY_DN2275_c0_g1_i1.p1 TRINITY_DN2275_c0_g1~~TRINITY_DN2275_c0_g1_i1.p1  ORF type:complete len:92 (-),score=2.11 TRINITY_DN2275_c0_g1_i1:75-350(-)